MRAEEFGRGASLAGLPQDFHHVEHRVGIVAGLGHEADAQAIGFQFVVAAEIAG